MKYAILNFALLGLCVALPAGAAETRVDRSVAADPHGSVSISNVAGRVEVQGWDRPEVQVTGTLGSGVERLDLLKDGSNTVVKVILPHLNLSGDSGQANLVVHVPTASRTEVSTVSADLSVHALQGVQSLRTVSGDIATDLAAMECEIKTVSGDLTVRGVAQAAPLRVSTVSGDLRLSRAAGAVEIVTVSGDLALEVKPMSSLRVRTTSGDIHIDAHATRDAKLDVETVSGDVILRAASDAGFATEVNSFSGDISTCFGVRSERNSEYGPGTRLRTKVGAGSAAIRVKTLSGDVSVCDK